MKNKFAVIIFLLFSAFSIAGNFQVENSLQNIPQDSLGEVTDAFQEHFFEGMKQKAIENYDKALAAFQQCEKIDPESAVVYFEMGKTYLNLKKTDKAIESFQTSNRLAPNRQWTLIELLNAYYANKNYEQAILIAKSLVKFDANYNDYLAKLYFETRQYDALLNLLDTLDAKLGINEYRNGLRQEIYALTNNKSAQIETLQQAIKVNPENEHNYLKLIFVYSEQGMASKALQTAEIMRTKFPTSKVVHLALYKFYLESGRMEEALNSMKIVLKAEEIDANSKFKVLNDFLMFVNDHPQYENELKEVVALFSEKETTPEVFQRLGEYYLSKNEKEKALSYFQLGLNEDDGNFKLVKNILSLQIELQKNSEAVSLSKKTLEIFPAQAQLYLLRGTALNNLQQFKEAAEILTFGLDYLIDEDDMASEFYNQLIIAYTGLGNMQKAAQFEKKRKELTKNID